MRPLDARVILPISGETCRLITGVPVQARHPTCKVRGDPRCELVFTWKEPAVPQAT